jgi:hypothetical protein
MGRGSQNRPFKYGSNDRREFIVQDSEVSLIAINDTNSNPIFLGRAKPGVPLSEDKWQIRKITYDSAEGATRVTWPLNSDSVASADFEFIWSTVSELTITGISNANPGVVTVSSLGTLTNGDSIVIQNVVGTTEVNFTGSNLYTVANINVGAKTFELSGIDTTAFGVYTSGGTVNYGEVVNYTYA